MNINWLKNLFFGRKLWCKTDVNASSRPPICTGGCLSDGSESIEQHMVANRETIRIHFSMWNSMERRKLFRQRNAIKNDSQKLSGEKFVARGSELVLIHYFSVAFVHFAVYQNFSSSVTASRRDTVHEFTIYQNDKSMRRPRPRESGKGVRDYVAFDRINLIHLPVGNMTQPLSTLTDSEERIIRKFFVLKIVECTARGTRVISCLLLFCVHEFFVSHDPWQFSLNKQTTIFPSLLSRLAKRNQYRRWKNAVSWVLRTRTTATHYYCGRVQTLSIFGMPSIQIHCVSRNTLISFNWLPYSVAYHRHHIIKYRPCRSHID